jgi:hypothetical protein
MHSSFIYKGMRSLDSYVSLAMNFFRYDHRIREQKRKTGTNCLPQTQIRIKSCNRGLLKVTCMARIVLCSHQHFPEWDWTAVLEIVYAGLVKKSQRNQVHLSHLNNRGTSETEFQILPDVVLHHSTTVSLFLSEIDSIQKVPIRSDRYRDSSHWEIDSLGLSINRHWHFARSTTIGISTSFKFSRCPPQIVRNGFEIWTCGIIIESLRLSYPRFTSDSHE